MSGSSEQQDNPDYRESWWTTTWLRLRYRLGLLQDDLKVKSQAAALPYQVLDGEIVVLLVTSSTRQRWVFPKGGVEDGESNPQAALREAQEEAGVTGRIYSTPIGTYSDLKLARKGPRQAQIEIFPLEVHKQFEDWDEDGKRFRQWVAIEEAKRLISISDLVPVLDQLEQLLQQSVETT